MVHHPALVEVTDELVHPVFALKRAHPLDAVIRIAEHPYLAVEILVFDLFETGEDLAESLEALEVCLVRGPDQLDGHAQKAHQTRLAILTRLRPTPRNMNRKSQSGVARRTSQPVAVDCQPRLELVGRIYQWRSEDRQLASPGKRKGVRTVGCDTHRRMRGLHRPRHNAEIPRPKILSLEGKALVGPGLEDEIKCFLETLTALFHGYAVAWILVCDASAHSEFQTSIAEDIGGCRFFGDLYRVVQREQCDRRPKPNTRRALSRCGQHHKRVSQNRERAAEVDFSKPGCIEAESVP